MKRVLQKTPEAENIPLQGAAAPRNRTAEET